MAFVYYAIDISNYSRLYSVPYSLQTMAGPPTET